jgi:hypothetical protein
MEEVPEGWVRHETPCSMSFLGPETLVEVTVQGVDSCVLQFMDDDCVVGGGRGGYSSGLSAQGIAASGAYEREMTIVDGREASSVTARTEDPERPYFAGVHVPLGTSVIGPISAELYVSCGSAEVRDVLVPMLSTLQIGED